ncbi:hypothetical protein ACFQ21_18445 [Ohtaekwangia kribbensis]|uniref:Uncharacterized protein n=1 Tax=Ohtaekwangia kribbensis TaxID=688913 RepID=A0ABW3K679_9BACT
MGFIDKISYRKRNIYLVIIVLVLAIVAYFIAIKKTIVLYKKNKNLVENIGADRFARDKLNNAQNRLQDLNNYFDAYTLDSLKKTHDIMSEFSSLCRTLGVTLKSFPQSVLSVESNLQIETLVIETEGNFINQLQLLYALETKNRLGRVASVTYKSYTDNRRKKTILSLTIYLQNIRSNAEAMQI